MACASRKGAWIVIVIVIESVPPPLSYIGLDIVRILTPLSFLIRRIGVDFYFDMFLFLT